jgi:hypothetical protein
MEFIYKYEYLVAIDGTIKNQSYVLVCLFEAYLKRHTTCYISSTRGMINGEGVERMGRGQIWSIVPASACRDVENPSKYVG